ncbi:hypothetical protein MSG28_004250 [Choristoneura fumiferana]|uniref:Uncharacterized protein n=1 Tax=Choristoneura fumiferana TaxID=7141 RepID=A0ACC0KI75_CHOFU|nr:hypothetical protein MSG28_004250 [Choristoneura fumiferana]
MRNLAKLFFYTSFSFLLLFLYYTVKELKKTKQELLADNRLIVLEQNLEKLVDKLQKNVNAKSDLKYILQWTNPKNVPFVYMGVGQQVFIDRKCKYTNCFVTDDRDYLGDVTKFDAIAFAGTDVIYMSRYDLPKKRSPHQKYAFTNIESADNYPVCTNRFNNFFNWTWTYRLDSETKWGYLIVRDAKNNIIGPKTEMHWMKLEDMDPIDDALRVKLRNKTKAAAWFVSNCRSRSGRETYFRNLIKALKPYNLTVDIYGKCGPLKCDRNKEAECNDMVERDYYFYLSFENSFAEDYATEKLAHGLQHNAIPIVYGGANYTRFMPDGIYLNARQLGPEALAKQMKHLIDNPDEYDNYFRWKKYYSYHRKYESPETDDYCGFCMLLNNEEMVKKTFMPDGIYLNARQLGPEALAKKMKHLIDNPDEYENFFRWKKYYSFHRRFESVETDDYCGFCILLNNEAMVKKTSIYKNFKQWWNPSNRCP